MNWVFFWVVSLAMLAGLAYMVRDLMQAYAIRHVRRAVDLVAEMSEPREAKPEPGKYDTAAGETWLNLCRLHAMRIAHERGTVTVDDVWEACPPPAAVDGRLLGGLFRGDGWERVGTRQSARGRNATREIVVWQRVAEQIDLEDVIAAKGRAA